jgi:hypothetical protein
MNFCICVFEPLILIKYDNFSLYCAFCQFNLCYESVNSSLKPHTFSCNTLNSAELRVSVNNHNYLHVLKFYVLLTVRLGILCNDNQLDALFSFNLFHQNLYMFRACLLPITRRYSLYMYTNWYVLYV